ncbi:MAG: DUF4212 domain-containing protein [Pseudomonadota bacterium]|nr:DUF4212 domain-containing protein [Pseudomonadota bacterium]
MIEEEQRGPHWRRTTVLAVICLSFICLTTLATVLLIDVLNEVEVLRFPLGFYMAAQGAVILIVAMLFWFSDRQERLDRKYGSSEHG